MNSNKLSWRSARTICIVKTLAKLGHYPTRKSEKEAWFLSPLRSETQASFSVSLTKNLWFDYGMGKGGNTIDLLMALKNCSFEEAMNFLSNDCFTFFSCPKPIQNTGSINEGLIIIDVDFVSHPALTKYIESRAIPFPIARNHCREIRYRIKSKEYFAIGLQNHLGGWELRNKYYKNSSSPKFFSYLKRNNKTLLITEGMFDFLSLATLQKELVATSDCIVLNSIAFIEKIKILLPRYKQVQLYLDNDPAGTKASGELVKLYSNVTDKSDFYKHYKDLNEKLKNESR